MRILTDFFGELGGMTIFTIRILRMWIRTFGKNGTLLIEQIAQVAFRSLSTILFSGFFVGAILVIQFHLMLSKYDAISLLGGLNTSATIREVGPLIISFLLAGKVGAYTAAELGTMRVTEQIDAIRCLGTNPLQYLVVPRFIAIVICSVLLLVFGVLVGVGGSMLVAVNLHNMNFLQYMQSIPRFTSEWTVIAGVFKSFVYGLIVATVSTYKGYYAKGGAQGVGRAVTQCAVYTNLLIVLANSFTSDLLENLQHFFTNTLGGRL